MPLYGGEEQKLGGGIILYEKLKDQKIAVVTLNRPDAMNAYIEASYDAMNDAFDMARDDGDVSVILLTGYGRAYCAGADMNSLSDASAGGAGPPPSEAEKKERERRAAEGIQVDQKGRSSFAYPLQIPKPIIVAINGACAGIGMSIAMNCDIRFAAEGANFSTAFPRRGLIAEGGISWSMPRVAGVGNAMDVLLSGRKFTAEEAKSLGLVQRVFPKERLIAETIAYAADMAANVPSNSMAVIKGQILNHQHRDAETALRESNRLMLMSTTKANPDFAEGVSSYTQKRAPKFNPLNLDSPMQKLRKELFGSSKL